MVENNGKRIGKSNATLAVLGLLLGALLPLAAAASESPATTASSNATLSAFADGSVSKTLTFAAGADARALVELRLPKDAAVADASLEASASGTSGASTGALVFDIGADGTADATASVTVRGATKVVLPGAAIEAYLGAHGVANSTVDVPVRITGAASAPWQAVVSGVDIEYATDAQLIVAPTFVGEIEAAAVVAGQTNFSAVDLGAHFAGGSGGNLTFSAQLAADAQTSASGVSVVLNGTRADLRASNPEFWGEVQVRFAGADANGQVAFSNEVAVHVEPRPVTVPTVRTDARLGAQAVLTVGCGSPGLVERFEIPADAVVTEARMTVQGSVVASLLGGTIDILAGAEAVAGVNASDLPREVVLNASALNAQLRGQASAFGLVDLDLAADVCPSGSLDGLAVSNIAVTYVRGGNATVRPEPVIAAIAVDGQVDAQVGADQGLTLELVADEALNSSSQVDWYIDGKLAGSGETLSSVELSQGEHTVEARATAGAVVHTYSATVNATSRAEAQAQIAINGAVTTAVESGESLILELRTPQPLSGNASVEWYVDGKLAGRGQVLAGVELTPGVHSVEARENSSGTVHSYASQVNAAGTAPTAGLAAALVVSAALCLCAVGAVAWRRRR
jgi:hypothetical protein